jgi:hypothetical protein
VDGLSVSYWEVLDMGTGTLSETDASAALKRIALVLLAISVSVFFCFYEEVLVSVNSSSASSALGGPFQLPSAAADHAPVDARSALFLTWVNATSYACCNMTLPSSISIRTSPGIASPSSLSYFDTRTSGGSAPRSVYGDGRSVFEKLYSNIVLTSPLSYFPTNQKQLGKADSASLITSGGVRGLYYDAQDLSAQDLSASPTPSVVIPKPLHITRTVALKSLYGAALRHLSPAVLANKEVGVTKGMTAYPVPPVPVIPGRITGSTAPPKNVPTNSKLSRALVLANLTSAFSILADEIILALFLARERYIGASSAFAPWIQMLQDVDETVDLGPVRERVRKMSMPVLNGQYVQRTTAAGGGASEAVPPQLTLPLCSLLSQVLPHAGRAQKRGEAASEPVRLEVQPQGRRSVLEAKRERKKVSGSGATATTLLPPPVRARKRASGSGASTTTFLSAKES